MNFGIFIVQINFCDFTILHSGGNYQFIIETIFPCLLFTGSIHILNSDDGMKHCENLALAFFFDHTVRLLLRFEIIFNKYIQDWLFFSLHIIILTYYFCLKYFCKTNFSSWFFQTLLSINKILLLYIIIIIGFQSIHKQNP